MLIKRKIILMLKFLELKLKRVEILFSLHSNISMNVDISNKGKRLRLGKVYIRGNTCINTSDEGDMIIGSNVFFNHNCVVACRKKIVIGAGCIFGPNVCIYDHDHNYNENGVCTGYACDEVIIEDNCWIGAGVIILKGTHIGKNSIIAAGTVVKGNFEDGVLIYNSQDIKIKKLKDRKV